MPFQFLPLTETSLYIHIPYCIKKCSYCDFYSCPISSESEIKFVLNRILDDTSILLLKTGSPLIKTLFIGGGTPSSVPNDILLDFLRKLGTIVKNHPDEYTIELNPETISKELLLLLKDNGINRISVGVQSLDDNLLKTLGRNTNAANTRTALETVKKYWNGSFNTDLINAVPGQTVKTALRDIRDVEAYGPDHISLYSLTYEKSTKLYSMLKAGRVNKISESIDFTMQNKSRDLLKALGFNRYEISNYAKKDHQSKHNINYWRMGSYLGVGPSAASTIMTKAGPVRLEYKRSIAEFMNSKILSTRMKSEVINPQSFLLEHLMMGFRLIEGVDLDRIKHVFGINLTDFFPTTFSRWGSSLIQNNRFLALSTEGLNMLDLFLGDISGEIDNISINTITWP